MIGQAESEKEKKKEGAFIKKVTLSSLFILFHDSCVEVTLIMIGTSSTHANAGNLLNELIDLDQQHIDLSDLLRGIHPAHLKKTPVCTLDSKN